MERNITDYILVTSHRPEEFGRTINGLIEAGYRFIPDSPLITNTNGDRDGYRFLREMAKYEEDTLSPFDPAQLNIRRGAQINLDRPTNEGNDVPGEDRIIRNNHWSVDTDSIFDEEINDEGMTNHQLDRLGVGNDSPFDIDTDRIEMTVNEAREEAERILNAPSVYPVPPQSEEMPF